MADLKYDTATMRNTASNYKEIAVKLSRLETVLKNQITELKSTYWKSDAGNAFQDLYEEGWAKNVDKYVKLLDEMAGQLDKAANDYDSVTAELRKIEGVYI